MKVSGAGFDETDNSAEMNLISKRLPRRKKTPVFSAPKQLKEPFSHSRLVTFEQCRKQYWYRYVEKQPDLYDGIEACISAPAKISTLVVPTDVQEGSYDISNILCLFID